MNKKIISCIALALLVASFFTVLGVSTTKAIEPSSKTYYLGDEIPNNQQSYYTYFFGGICATSAGTHVMALGFRDYNNAASCSYNFFIEVSINATVNIGHINYQVSAFTTDSVTLISL